MGGMRYVKTNPPLLNIAERQHRLIERDSWICAWYKQALSSGFIAVPWEPDEVVVALIEKCFDSGLTPDDAIVACFGLKC